MAVSSAANKPKDNPSDRCRTILDEVKAGNIVPVYLFAGEFPVTAGYVKSLVSLLLPSDSMEMNLHELSSESAAPGRCVEFLETRGFFPGRKVLLLRDPPFLHSSSTVSARWKTIMAALEKKDFARAGSMVSQILGILKISVAEVLELKPEELRMHLKWPGDEPIEPLKKFLENQGGAIMPSAKGMDKGAAEILIRWLKDRAAPEKSVMLIQSEVVDKRNAVYKAIKATGRVVDFNLTGSTKQVRSQAGATVRKLLADRQVSIESRAVELLLDLVGEGNIPALMKETEKLVSMVGTGGKGKKRITAADVKRLVSHQREEELFRLTGAIGRQDLNAALESLHLLLDQGVHPLAVLSTINNYIKKMLAITAAAPTVGTDSLEQASFNIFRNRLLPKLLKFYKHADQEPLKAHPYALYMQCREAGKFNVKSLTKIVQLMPETDMELKGGAADPRLVLEMLVMKITDI